MVLSEQTFFKISPVDEHRVQIVLWDYRFANPIQFGMIMNLGDEDFDAHSLEYALVTLSVNMANYVARIAMTN